MGLGLQSNASTRTRLRSRHRQHTAATIPESLLLLQHFPVAFDLRKCGGKLSKRSVTLQSSQQHAACKAVFERGGQVARALGFLATTFPASRSTRVIAARALTLL